MRPRSKAELTEQMLVVTGLLLVALVLAWRLSAERHRIEAGERTHLAEQARIIDANLGRQLGAVDSALLQIREDLPELSEQRQGAGSLDARLRALSGAMPGVRTLFVLDRAGRVLASNRDTLIGQDFHERAYFRLARSSNDPGLLHVSPPIRNALGTYAINLERSLAGPDGAFAGLVAATLDPEYFATLMASVAYAPDLWVSLAHADGTLFLIVPDQQIPAGNALARPGSLFRRHMDSGQAATVLVGRVLATGEWRMAARRTVHPAGLPMDAPLVVAATRPLGGILAPWRRECWHEGILYGLFAFGVLLALRAYHRRRRLLQEVAADRAVMARSLQDRMTLFFDRDLVGMSISSRDTGWQQVNDRLCRMLGYTREEFRTHTLEASTHPDDRAADQAWHQALQDGTVDRFTREQRYLRKDGTVMEAELSVGCVRNPDGTLDSILALVADITDRKRGEAALRASEARFRAMFEANGSVMLLLNPEQGRIEDANPAAAAFYGRDRAALRGSLVSDYNTLPTEEVREALRQAAAEEANTFHFHHRLASGELRGVEVHTSPMTVDGRLLLFSIVVDVTDRQRLEQEIRLRQLQLEGLNQSLEARVREGVAELRAKDRLLIAQNRQAAMGEMIGHIAHQWRQPLSAMSMLLVNLGEACREPGPDLARVARMLAKGDGLVQKMSSTIDLFRDFFQPGKQGLPFSALEQVRAAVAIVDAGFEARGIDLQVEAPADLTFKGFANEFCQVLLNLLGNARQAIQERGVARGRITLRLETEAGSGCVRITDNGGGIPAEALDRIFEPYFSTREGGTGIGLYMSRQIIEESMQGRISARNVGEGAEFTLRLPMTGATP